MIVERGAIDILSMRRQGMPDALRKVVYASVWHDTRYRRWDVGALIRLKIELTVLSYSWRP